jgi:uncharacterized protein YuzE
MNINSNLTQLTRNDIVYLLEQSGYNETSSDIEDTKFVKVTNSGQIQYIMTYYDIDGNEMNDYVYVFINNKGKIAADY